MGLAMISVGSIMNGKSHPALLPAGLIDLLPPEAEFEAGVMNGLIAAFTRYGYDQAAAD